MLKKSKLVLQAVLPLTLAGLLLAGCGGERSQSASPSPGEALTAGEAEQKYLRSGEARGVEVEVVWIAPASAAAKGNPASQYDPRRQFIFELTMTTHGGNLLAYDVRANAVLRAAGQELPAGEWTYTAEDTHHPAGILVFNPPPGANDLQPDGTAPVTLVLKDLNGVPERVFTWE